MKPPPLPPSLVNAPPRGARAGAGAAGVGSARVRAVTAQRSGARTWFWRLTTVLICAGSAGLVYWSLFERLLPVSREHQASTIEMSRLSDEVEQMRLRWDPVEAEETRARYHGLGQLLFGEATELEGWETGLERDAGPQALEAVLTMGPGVPEPGLTDPIERVGAELEVWPLPVLGLTNSPYRRVMGYLQDVVNTPKRIDLLELRVVGESNSVQEARARLEVLRGTLGERKELE
jgi:hypothetical protein